jgi:hypothetical protein
MKSKSIKIKFKYIYISAVYSVGISIVLALLLHFELMPHDMRYNPNYKKFANIYEFISYVFSTSLYLFIPFVFVLFFKGNKITVICPKCERLSSVFVKESKNSKCPNCKCSMKPLDGFYD